MVTENNKTILDKLDFEEPRLQFSLPVRSLIKVVSYGYYSLMTAAAAVAFFSEIDWLKWLGALYLLFLADFLISARKAEHSLSELSGCSLSGVNVASYLTPKSLGLIEEAFEKSLIFNSGFHLNLLKLLSKEDEIRGALWRLEVSPEEFEQKIDEEIKNFEVGGFERKDLLSEAALFAKEAFLFALSSHSHFIEPRDLFGALGRMEKKSSSKIFYLFSIDRDDLQSVLVFSRFRKKYLKESFLPVGLGGFARKVYKSRRRVWHWAWFGRHSPLLDKFGEDLMEAASAGEAGFLIGHAKEYEKMVEIILQPQKNNVLLIGDAHSGRSTIVAHLAFEIAKNRKPLLADRDIIALKSGDLFPEGASADLPVQIAEEINRAGNLIVHFPDFEKLLENAFATDIFFRLAAEGKVQIIGSLSPGRDIKIQKLADNFDLVEVNPISEDDAVRLLSFESVILEAQLKILVGFSAIKQAVVYGQKSGPLPFAARAILKEAAEAVVSGGGRFLDKNAVLKAFEKISATK